jgi:MinD superfamily P-loop ATPase
LKQITVISGKGGTGKTSLTGSLAALSKDALFADCDVDASNLHLLLKPDVLETIKFKGLKLAHISEEKCIGCGICAEKCRFNAIDRGDVYRVNPLHCEGCGVCVRVCPVEAVKFEDQICGHAYISETRFGPMVHADLIPGMENSGKLVTLVRQTAQHIAEGKGKELVLIDGPPGIGCPVIASLSGIDASLVVVEPTLSGIHDLKRVLHLLDHFKIKPLVCINKHDINPKNTMEIVEFLETNGINLVGLIPFDDAVTKAMVAGCTVVEFAPNSLAGQAIEKVWFSLRRVLEIKIS